MKNIKFKEHTHNQNLLSMPPIRDVVRYVSTKKSLILIALFWLLLPPTQAQTQSLSNYVSIDTILNFKQETPSPYTSICSASWGDWFGFTAFDTKNNSDTVKIHLINTSTLEQELLCFVEKGICKKMRKHLTSGFWAIGFTEKTMVLAMQYELLIYKKTPNGQYSKTKSAKIPFSYHTMHMLNDSTIVFGQCYHSADPETGLYLFDINKKKVTKAVHPHHNSTLLNGYINGYSCMDCTSNCIIWRNSNEYSFLGYDSNLNPIDSTAFPDTCWRPIPDKLMNRLLRIDKRAPTLIIERLLPIYDSIDALIGCYLLDDTHLIIVRKKPSAFTRSPFMTIDVWTKCDGTWKRTLSDIADDGWKDTVMTKNNFPVKFEFNKVRVAGGKLVSLSKNGSIEQPIGLTRAAYDTQTDAYLIENNKFIQVFIYSHTLTAK